MATVLFRLTRGFCAGLVLAAAHAQAVPLSDLVAGQSIEIGDKRFDGFMLLQPPVDSELGDPIDLSAVDVTGIGDGAVGNEFGLNFSFGAESGFTIGSETSADFMSLFFAYRVTVTTPGNLISAVSLAADASAVGADAFVGVSKFDAGSAGSDLLGGPIEVFSDTAGTDSLSESRNVIPVSEILVGDAIILSYDASNGPSMASLTSFEQRFSQITREVPVPATLLLVVLGLFGLRLARRRD